MKTLRAFAGIVALVAGASQLQAQATHVTSRSGITGHTLSWFSLFAPAPFTINNAPKATPLAGLTVTVNAAAPAQLLTQKWGSWPGNFSPDDEILYSHNGPIEFLFSDDVFAFGSNVQSSNFSSFIGSITAYDSNNNQVGSFSANGMSTWQNDGSAIFLGLGSDVGFRRIVMNTSGSGIAINQAIFGELTRVEEEPPFGQYPPYLEDPPLTLSEGDLPVITNPEPASVVMFSAGMIMIGAVYRRRRKHG